MRVVPQLRTTNLDATIDFYVSRLGATLEFRYSDFYAGLRLGDSHVHLKRVDTADPSIDFVREGNHLHLYIEVDDLDAMAATLTGRGVEFVMAPHGTAWGTRELAIRDDQGHTLYFSRSA
jgi:uncharacterized glyoxalase superfamily protein PhnB